MLEVLEKASKQVSPFQYGDAAIIARAAPEAGALIERLASELLERKAEYLEVFCSIAASVTNGIDALRLGALADRLNDSDFDLDLGKPETALKLAGAARDAQWTTDSVTELTLFIDDALDAVKARRLSDLRIIAEKAERIATRNLAIAAREAL